MQNSSNNRFFVNIQPSTDKVFHFKIHADTSFQERAKRDISIDCHPSEKTYHGNGVSRGIKCQRLK